VLVPSSQVASGVFQNAMVLKYELLVWSAWYFAHEPACRVSITPHALLFTGVSPKDRACSACTCGVLTHLAQR
jgi:hypothetical protein